MDSFFASIHLDKSVPVPLYYQLKKQLHHVITTAGLQPGYLLPPENEFSEYLNISRPTVRQALVELAEEGYLERHKGKGTFIAKPKVQDRFLSKLQSFNEEMRTKGIEPSTRVISLEKIPGTPAFNEKLGLDFDAPLIHLQRIRYGDNVPLVYVNTYLPHDGYEKLLTVDFRENSLYTMLEQLYGIQISHAMREIEAVTPRKHEAEFLEIKDSAPICFVRTLGYPINSEIPIEYSVACYRGDRTKFAVKTFR